MASNIQTAGIATLNQDGLFLDVASDLSYSVNTVSYTPLIGQSGPQGFRTEWVYGMMSAQLRATNLVSAGFFNGLSGVTVNAVLANGVAVIGTNMAVQEVQTVNTEQGTYEVKWFGSVLETAVL